MPKTVKVHVTFDETKRVLSHQKGAEVQGLRPVFLQVFSDVLSSDIAPAQVKFQRYDDKFEDYVELSNEERFEEDIKIRALVTKRAKQVLLVTLAVIFNIHVVLRSTWSDSEKPLLVFRPALKYNFSLRLVHFAHLLQESRTA